MNCTDAVLVDKVLMMTHLDLQKNVSRCTMCVPNAWRPFSAASPEHPGSFSMTSIIFAAAICDADDPCSVNTAYDPESFFHKVTSENDSAFVLLISRFQLRILEMTGIHQ